MNNQRSHCSKVILIVPGTKGQERIVLVRNKSHKKSPKWTFGGGERDEFNPNELPLETLIREVGEEYSIHDLDPQEPVLFKVYPRENHDYYLYFLRYDRPYEPAPWFSDRSRDGVLREYDIQEFDLSDLWLANEMLPSHYQMLQEWLRSREEKQEGQ